MAVNPEPALRDRHLVVLGQGGERTGPPILLGHLLAGLRTEGARCTVLLGRDGPLADRYRDLGAQVRTTAPGREPLEPLAAGLRRLGAERAVPPVQDAWRRHALRGIEPADLVYVNGATPPTAALLRALSPPPSAPVVLHVHELDMGLRRTLDPLDRQALLGRADLVLAASSWVERTLVEGHGLPAERVVCCPEFIDVAAVAPLPRSEARAAAGLPPAAPVVGSVGTIDRRKAPELLLHALASIGPAALPIEPWVLWIGGDPSSPEGLDLADEAARVGLGARFRHLPHQDDPGRLLHALDVFALPAREDALPLAALEAGAASRPIACFRAGGVADLCDAGAGTAVDYPDVVALGRAIGALLADAAGAAEVGRRARDLVEADHDLEVGVARIVAAIAPLLHARR